SSKQEIIACLAPRRERGASPTFASRRPRRPTTSAWTFGSGALRQLRGAGEQLLAGVFCRVFDHLFEQGAQNPAEVGPGLDPELAHQVVAVHGELAHAERRAGREHARDVRAEVFELPELGAHLAALRLHVGFGELVELRGELGTHAAEPATHGRVAPRAVVTDEVVAHERDDARALFVREAQALEERARHFGADALVLVERVVVRLLAPGARARLADVVQEARDAQNWIARARVEASEPVSPHVVRVIPILLD